MSAAAANGPANEHVEEMTRETMMPHMELMVHKLQTRMMKLIQVMSTIDHEIAKRKSTPNTTHRIQSLRQGRVINKGKHRTQKSVKRFGKLFRRHMIFTHDVKLLLRRYTKLFKQAGQILMYLRGESVPTPLPPAVVADGNMLAEYYIRYNQLYIKINEEHESLHRMFRGENTTNAESNSNNNAEPNPNVRFGPPLFHAIPHREDAANEYLPAAMPAAMGGNLRERSLRKRTLRKKRLRNNRRTLRERTLRKRTLRERTLRERTLRKRTRRS